MKAELLICATFFALAQLTSSAVESGTAALASRGDENGSQSPTIHLEWPFVEKNGKSIPQRKDIAGAFLGDQLKFKTLVEGSGLLHLSEIANGTLVAQPISTPTDAIAINLLDIPVSLHLDGVSTWEAFRALSLAVTRQKEVPFPLLICPTYWAYGGGPPEFFEPKHISVDARDTPARLIVLDIIAQSPVTIRYDYGVVFADIPNRGHGRLTLYFFREGQYLQPRTAPEEAENAWITELESYMAEIKIERQAIEERKRTGK